MLQLRLLLIMLVLQQLKRRVPVLLVVRIRRRGKVRRRPHLRSPPACARVPAVLAARILVCCPGVRCWRCGRCGSVARLLSAPIWVHDVHHTRARWGQRRGHVLLLLLAVGAAVRAVVTPWRLLASTSPGKFWSTSASLR